MRYNLPARVGAMARLAFLLGAEVASSDPTVLAEAAIAAVEQLRADIGIPRRLRDLGVTAEMLPGFAEKAFAIKRLMRVNPRMPTQEDILAIYRSAY
jgi:alcohol dehydrogenase class IV